MTLVERLVRRLPVGAALALAAPRAVCEPPAPPPAPDTPPLYASSCALPCDRWTPLPLKRVTPYNHDTSVFEFGLPPGAARLDLPVCGCLLLLAPGREHGGGDAVRPYTPVRESDGGFELLVKRYAEWGEPPADGALTGRAATLRRSYRPAGAVSNYVHELRPGEDVAYFKHIHANVKIPYPFRGATRVNLIAVGAGIAPMVQALEKLLETEGDETQVVLMYGNRDVPDILLREKLDAWALAHARRFKLVYCVGSRWANVHYGAKPKARAKGQYVAPPPPEIGIDGLRASGARVAAENGWVDQRVIEAHAFPPSRSTLTFVCGLPGVYDALCGPRNAPGLAEGSALANLGYTPDRVVKF